MKDEKKKNFKPFIKGILEAPKKNGETPISPIIFLLEGSPAEARENPL